MPTKTQTATDTKTVVQPNAKLAPLTKQYTQATGEQIQRKVALAQAVVEEGKKLGADKAEMRKVVAATFLQAIDAPANASEELQAVYLKQWQSDISRIMTLAYPDAPEELRKALAHNAKCKSLFERIGEVKLIRIANGGMSFADTLAGKIAARGGRPEGNNGSTKTPREKFTDAIATAMNYVGFGDNVSAKEASALFAEALAKREEALKAATK